MKNLRRIFWWKVHRCLGWMQHWVYWNKLYDNHGMMREIRHYEYKYSYVCGKSAVISFPSPKVKP